MLCVVVEAECRSLTAALHSGGTAADTSVCFARRQQDELTVAEGGVVCPVFLKDQGDIFTNLCWSNQQSKT